MHLIIYVRFYYENKCSKINCFISAKIFNSSIELTGVFKCYLNPGGSYSKSSPLTLMKIIFNLPNSTFDIFISFSIYKKYIKIILKTLFITFYSYIYNFISNFFTFFIIKNNNKITFNFIPKTF